MNYGKFNKNTRVFKAEAKNREFVQLSKLYEENADRVYTLYGFFPNTKGKFGKSYIAMVGDNGLVDLPHHLNEMLETISADKEAVDGINNGECKFKIRQYVDKKFNKTCYSIEFVDDTIPF